jgi:hypothetical protein
MPPATPLTGGWRLAAVAAVVNARVVDVSDDVRERLTSTIPELRGDDVVVNLLAASVEGNVATVLHIFEHSIVPEDLEAPAAALEYARRLAQRGVPLHALVRAYRVGHARFLRWCLDELARQVQDAAAAAAVTDRMLDLSFRSIDQVSERMITIYQQERDRWRSPPTRRAPAPWSASRRAGRQRAPAAPPRVGWAGRSPGPDRTVLA